MPGHRVRRCSGACRGVAASRNQHLPVHGARCILVSYAEVSVRVIVISVENIRNGDEQVGCHPLARSLVLRTVEILRYVRSKFPPAGGAVLQGKAVVKLGAIAPNSIERASRGKQG